MTITEDFHALAVEMLKDAIPEPNAIWVQSDDGNVTDPNKPWDVEHGDTVEHPVRILFFPRDIKNNELIMYLRGTEIPAGVVFGLMYRYDDFEPDLNDFVKWNEKELAITHIDPIQPVDDAIIYLLEFRN